MKIFARQYEITSVNSLLVGDMFTLKLTSYTVLEKKFESIEVFNHNRNKKELWNLPMTLTVTRVKGGILTV